MKSRSTGVKRFTQYSESPFINEGLSAFLEVSYQISTNNLYKLFTLSRASQRVLLYLLSESKTGQIQFDLLECKQFTGFKNDRSVFDGLIELLGTEIIARGKRQVYFINKQIIKTISKDASNIKSIS
jgi:hypothetical protein